MMSPLRPLVPVFILLAACSSTAVGQGITLQLPTYRTFRVSTTVSVPDRGGAYLGGVNSARSSRQRLGSPITPGGVARGSSRQSSGVHASAFIHHHQEIDRALLERGRDASGNDARAASPKSDPSNIDEMLAKHKVGQKSQQAEAQKYVLRGFPRSRPGKTIGGADAVTTSPPFGPARSMR